MKDPHDGERVGSRVIHNQVGKHRPEFDRQRRQVLAEMTGFRVGGQQPEGRCDFLQYVSGEAASALACEIVPEFAEIFPGFRG